MKTDFRRKVLKNNMTVLFEKRDLPVVSVMFAVRNGGVNETENEKGISHFIEHMLYKGTPSRNAKKIAEEIERNGGELNGFTEESITAYWCKIPSDKLKIALEVLGDMVKNPLFDEKELEKERKVIFEEIKMRKDIPAVFVIDEIKNQLYEKPFGPSLIGTYETMSSIDRKKIVEKFKKIYTPNNLILCVVGDADFDEIVNFAEKNFGDEKSSVPQLKIKLKNNQKIFKRKGIDQANLVFAYHVPLAENKLNYAARVLNVLMAGGMSSRLFEEIREKRNLAYAIKGESDIAKNYSYNLIYVGTTPENVEKVKKLILKEFEKVSKNLSEKELNSVKTQMIGNYKIAVEDSQLQMVELVSHEVDGDAEEFYEYGNNVKKVKVEDVKKIAADVLKKNSFVALVPEVEKAV